MTLNCSLMILYILKLLTYKTSYKVWFTDVDQSHIFLFFCLGAQGHWFWSQFTCGSHISTESTPSELSWGQGSSQVIDNFTRSLPPAEKTLLVDTQCLTKHKFRSLSLSSEIYMVSLFYLTSYLHSSWRNKITYNSSQHQSCLKLAT